MEHNAVGHYARPDVLELGVLADVAGVAGAGYHHDALLQVPAEDGLGRGHAVRRGDLRDHGVPEELRGVAAASSMAARTAWPTSSSLP